MRNIHHNEILKFLDILRDSFGGAEEVYSRGSCYRLYLILKHFWDEAVPLHDPINGHVYTKIDGRLYDIFGYHETTEYKLETLEDSLPIDADPMEWKYIIK